MTIITIICILLIGSIFFGGFWYVVILAIGLPISYGLHKVVCWFFEEHFVKKLKKYCKENGYEYSEDYRNYDD